jgi:hypothetical protein
MANPPTQNNSGQPSWPVTFAEVEEAQLKAWLGVTPAQRLAMAEELLSLARMAEASRARNTAPKDT